jgi:hypothetical protein
MSASPLSLQAQSKTDAPLIAPSSSSKENKYLSGFMRSPAKPQLDEEAQQAQDKEPFSLISPLKQAEDGTLEAQQGQRAGDVEGHGGSMSASHGPPPLIPQLVHT